jgi:hypothetical protein
MASSELFAPLYSVMPALVPAIPFMRALCSPKRDARDKRGHDSYKTSTRFI